MHSRIIARDGITCRRKPPSRIAQLRTAAAERILKSCQQSPVCVCVCVCVCSAYQNEEKPFIGDPLTGSLARAVSLSFFLSIKGHSLNIRRAAFAEPGSGRVARN